MLLIISIQIQDFFDLSASTPQGIVSLSIKVGLHNFYHSILTSVIHDKFYPPILRVFLHSFNKSFMLAMKLIQMQ